MCRLMFCTACTKYRAWGCNDREHMQQTISRVPEADRCKCREEQMAALEARTKEPK